MRGRQGDFRHVPDGWTLHSAAGLSTGEKNSPALGFVTMVVTNPRSTLSVRQTGPGPLPTGPPGALSGDVHLRRTVVAQYPARARRKRSAAEGTRRAGVGRGDELLHARPETGVR